MEQSEKDAGTLAALMLHLEEVRLPRALQLLDKVNAGGLLSDRDISFLKKVYQDSRANESLVDRHPEYDGIVCRCFSLYTEIITKGIENEKNS
ncbi:MAG: hypothetical protein WBN06_09230 [Lysobacterales bacterium]